MAVYIPQNVNNFEDCKSQLGGLSFAIFSGSKLLVLGMVIQPLIGNPYNGYINPYYWVDDHPLLYGNNGNLDPSTHLQVNGVIDLH